MSTRLVWFANRVDRARLVIVDVDSGFACFLPHCRLWVLLASMDSYHVLVSRTYIGRLHGCTN